MQTFQQYLTEVGNSFKPYRYTLFNIKHYGGDRHNAIFKFKVDSGDMINVFMDTVKRRNGIRTVVVFESVKRNFKTTNYGLKEAFRVVATVIEASIDYLKRINSEGTKTDVVFFSTMSDAGKSAEKGAQRTKLYLAFIKKKFPGAKIKMETDGYETNVEITVPDKFYK